MPDVLTEVPARALAIYAHPDDAEVSCGGTLAKWAAEGCDVHRVICTDGGRGTPDPAVDPLDLVVRRMAEATEAAKCLGVNHEHHLGYGDGDLVDGPELRGRIVALIRSVKPDAVLCPDPTAVFYGETYFNHRDHRVLGFAVLDACSPASGLPHYFPDAGPAHTVGLVLMSGALDPSVWVDVSGFIEAKAAAVACHRSQFSGDGSLVREAVKLRAAEDGRQVGLSFAEGFRRLRSGG